MLTWNEFDLEVQAILHELQSSGDFTAVNSDLPRPQPLTGRLTTTLYLTVARTEIASGRVFQVVLVEVGEDSEICNICIEEKEEPRRENGPGFNLGFRRYFFDLENLYRCLFRSAIGMVE